MPLFGSKNPPAQTITTTTQHQPQKSGLFGRRKSTLEPTTHSTTGPTRSGGGLFNRNPQAEPVHNGHTNGVQNGSSNHSGGLLSRHHEDASIVGARERVMQAERAEREADKSLIAARQAVRAAREHVKHLEREAKEEARLAKIKQGQAASLSKRGKALGRHDHT